jgi:hypothetical protein
MDIGEGGNEERDSIYSRFSFAIFLYKFYNISPYI